MYIDVIAECKYNADIAEDKGDITLCREFLELAVYYADLERAYRKENPEEYEED